MPVDGLRQNAADEQPDRAAGRRHEPIDADRLRLLPRLGEHRHDHAEDHGRGHRAADALDEARGHEHLLRLRRTARERGQREHREASHEERLAAEEVAEAAREQQQPAKRDQVRVHDPRERRLREAEVLLDRRQRDVHDGRVEHDHQHPHAEDDERDPARTVGRRLGAVLGCGDLDCVGHVCVLSVVRGALFARFRLRDRGGAPN